MIVAYILLSLFIIMVLIPLAQVAVHVWVDIKDTLRRKL